MAYRFVGKMMLCSGKLKRPGTLLRCVTRQSDPGILLPVRARQHGASGPILTFASRFSRQHSANV
jgi:hypothetical protein